MDLAARKNQIHLIMIVFLRVTLISYQISFQQGKNSGNFTALKSAIQHYAKCVTL